MGKRRKRQTVKQMLSWILVASLTAPSTSVLAAEAAEQVENAPRYVDFSRPAPLSLQEAGISSLNQNEDSGTGKTEEKEAEKQEKEESEKKQDSSGGQDKEPSADKEESEKKPEESDKPSADKEESEEKPEESDKPSADKEESEEKPEESENSSEEQEGGKPELPEESEDSSEGQEDETLEQPEEPSKGSEEDSEESEAPEEEEFPEEELEEKPAEPLEEIPLEEELPVEEELRVPEEFYDALESEEPDGELVQFSDFMRTYRTGDKEYTTVIGGYSGLYEKEDGTIGQTDDTLITVKEKRRLEKESEKMDETDAEPGTDTEEYRKATGSDAGKQDSDIEEDSAAEEGFMDYMISSSDLANTAGELEIQIPSRPSSSRGIRLKNGEAEMELLPKGGNFRKSAVEGNAIRFNEVYENVDYQYTIIGNTLKEDIILMEPSERTTFVYELEIPGMTAKKEGNAVAVYQKNEETPAFMLDAPFMEDDDGERSDDLELRISGKKDRVTVTVEADKKWLQDEDREYPVRIDPSSLVPSNELILCTVS